MAMSIGRLLGTSSRSPWHVILPNGSEVGMYILTWPLMQV